MEKETFDGNDIEVTETETSEQQVSEETEKPHKWRKPLLITLGGIAGTTAAVYIGTAAYFYFHCLPNTEINGKDFSYANRAEIEDYLKEDTKNYVLEIKGRENVKDQIQGSEIGVEYEVSCYGSRISGCGRLHLIESRRWKFRSVYLMIRKS